MMSKYNVPDVVCDELIEKAIRKSVQLVKRWTFVSYNRFGVTVDYAYSEDDIVEQVLKQLQETRNA